MPNQPKTSIPWGLTSLVTDNWGGGKEPRLVGLMKTGLGQEGGRPVWARAGEASLTLSPGDSVAPVLRQS